MKEIIGDVTISLDLDRPMRNIPQAQAKLGLQVLEDSNQYVPFQQGALRSSGRIEDDCVVWGGAVHGVRYAHYQYMGEVYGPNIPRKDADGNIIGWYSPPQKYPTGRDLQYHTPGTGAFWFEEAKEQHCKQWVDVVRREVLR